MDWNDVFEYRDGLLYWKIKTNRNMKIGRLAGSMAGNGYMQVHCFGKVRLMHRIIWEMHNGEIPEGMEIDHINHIRDDNRIENLRLVSRALRIFLCDLITRVMLSELVGITRVRNGMQRLP